MKDVKSIIQDLRTSGVRLSLKGENIEVDSSKGKLTDDIVAEVRSNKDRIIEYLKKNRSIGEFSRIQPAKEMAEYPLSSSQQRLWLISQFEEVSTAYHITKVYVFEGALDQKALEYSFNKVIERHEILRTVFKENKQGLVHQIILSFQQLNFTISYNDLRQQEYQSDELETRIQNELSKPFDLATGPLVRASLWQIENNKWVFTYTMHHIISDGWSMGILVYELLLFYNAYVNRNDIELPPLRIHYKDYAVWQKQQAADGVIKKHKAWWLKQFEGDLPVLNLPGSKVRPAVRTYNGAIAKKYIDAHTAEGIKNLCRDQGATLFMGMLGVMNILLNRYTGQEDIIIGTPVAARDHIDLDGQIGFYANTLPLRTRCRSTDSYLQVLSYARQVTLAAYEHQVYPFDELVNDLQVVHDRSRNPLFDIELIVQNAETAKKKNDNSIGKLQVKPYDGEEKVAAVFDMIFIFTELTAGMQAEIIYNSDIYTKDFAEQFLQHFSQLLDTINRSPHTPVSRLQFLLEHERDQLLIEFNNTALPLESGKTVVQSFQEQVARTPDHPAVVFENTKLTYKELDEQSDLLADYLRNYYNIQPDELIGVLLNRSANLPVAILGILKAGGAFVPIDPEYPDARKEYIFKDTGLRILITETDFIFNLEYYSGNIFSIDVQLPAFSPVHKAFPAITVPNHLAYVIYTSGSTGNPKGVMIEHTALANSIYAQQAVFNLQEGDKSLQFFSPAFDVAVFELFIAITTGAALYIVNEEVKRTPVLLEQFIIRHNINVATLPAAYLPLLQIEKLPPLKKLITGGESVSVDAVLPFVNNGTYYNAYGPTEASICVTICEFQKGDTYPGLQMPIGRPVANTKLYILDNDNNPMPVGAIGEIYIAGAGLARGYLNNPELTAEKFVPNPFKEAGAMYRTGDTGRWLPDGSIEFMGRKDDQLKIRGNRVELGEVQAALQSHNDIETCTVTAHLSKQGERLLVAYFVSNQELDSATLRKFMGDLMPAYMVPASFIRLPVLPLTVNGKIDKRMLPAPELLNVTDTAGYVPPRNAIEQKLASIWEELLVKERIGIHDDYFELGGNSLNAMVIIKRMIDETGISIPIRVLFEEKTIENISAYIDRSGLTVIDSHTISNIKEHNVVSDISYNQEIYFSGWKSGNDIVRANGIFDGLNVEAFKLAVLQLVERQEALRTIFISSDGIIKQQVLPFESISLNIADPEILPSGGHVNRIIANERYRKFELDKFPLFSVQLYKSETDTFCILFTMHHIITDGYSYGVLLNELKKLYLANLPDSTLEIDPLLFQYRDYCKWQRNFIASTTGAQHQAYWLNRLKGFCPALRSISHEHVFAQHEDALTITKVIAGNQLEEVDVFIKKNSLTRTVLLMGILKLTVNYLFNQNDVTLFTTVSGRNSKYYRDLDVTDLVGFFANSLLVRNIVDHDTTAIEFLLAVQHNFLNDLDYQDYPFGKLIKELPGIAPGDFMNSCVFYNYHNYNYKRENEYDYKPVEVKGKNGTTEAVQPVFGVVINEYKNCLMVQMIFNQLHFQLQKAAVLKQVYFSCLHQILKEPTILIKELKPQPETEII